MYEELSKSAINKIKEINNERAFKDENAVRRTDNAHDLANPLRSNFIKDTDKIMNSPYFPRYADKTQVISFDKNDDITHRSMHVQFVSRISRTIGKALGLNLELIESIALGHDIGHTPFGHAGEYALDNIYFSREKRHFFHNLHSVRVLEKIFPLNVTLQTLDGILCHDGELELSEYKPKSLSGFEEFDKRIEKCYTEDGYIKSLVPSTLEACVVRLSDIIAYLGKDRQDAVRVGILKDSDFTPSVIGTFNAEMINNLTVNVIENSVQKDYLKLDEEHFNALQNAKKENYEKIYRSPYIKNKLNEVLTPMMESLYEKLLNDLENKNLSSPIFTHHINYINKQYYKRSDVYEETSKNQIVVDYIASMTDDYFIDLYNYLFPKNSYKIEYKKYF